MRNFPSHSAFRTSHSELPLMIDLRGKRALVTGGTRGIGRATARLLEKAGATVAVAGRAKDGDLTDVMIAQRVVAAAVRQLGGLDILIVNHGVWPPAPVPLAKMSDMQWEHTRRANLDSMFYVCRTGLSHMSAGTIVLVSSTAGQRGEAFHADYAATKGAVIALTKSLAVEVAPQITVNCVAPGWVDTDMARPALNADIPKTIPLGRVATAEDVAGPIVFLCSSLARHITGEVLNVNGGSVLCG